MIFYRIALLLLLACAFCPPLRAETIYYSIRQMGFDGQASLNFAGPKEHKGRQTMLIIFRAHGTNYWDDEYIYVDPSSYKPLFVERDYSLGAFGHARITEEYQPSRIVISKTEGGHTTQQVIVKDAVDNIYGFIYRYRKEGDFKIGDTVAMRLPTRDLKLRLVKRAMLKVGRKSYNSYYWQSDPRKYRIWFDSSEHKWPLRISGSIGFINSVMTMTGYDEK